MNRQNRILFVVIGIFAALVAARAFVGDGMGRIYSELDSKEFMKVQIPILDQETIGDDTGDEPAAETGMEEVWVPAQSDDGREFRTADSVVENWNIRTQVPAREHFAGDNPAVSLDWVRTIGLWSAALFTLAIFSFLYRDNPVYKVAESVVVGVSAGYWMVVGFWDMIVPNLLGKLVPGLVQATFLPGLTQLDPHWGYLIPAAFGILLLMRLSPKGQSLSLWTLAFIVGTTAAIRMVGYIEGDFLSQVNATVVPIYQEIQNVDGTVNGYSTFWASVRQLTLLIGVLACLTYFFFSVEHKGAVGKVAKLGIWFLMITFGAAFGFTVMGRIALLAARFEFLFIDWLWLIDPAGDRVVASTAMLMGG